MITKATWGGAQRYVFDLARHLPAEFEPILVYGQAGRLSQELAQRRVQMWEIPTLRRDVSIFSDLDCFLAIRACIRKTKPDVVHLNSSKASALGALAARTCGVKKIIFTAHGWPFKEDRSVIARWILYLISWLTSLLSDAVIVVSKSDEAIGKRMWLVGKKIRYVPLGIESPQFISREEAGGAFSISTDTLRIVTIAELTKNKGISYAIEAIAQLKQRGIDCEYFIIGDGELRADLETLAREKDVADRVHFLGFVPDASNYLKAFDLFLLPSIKEGMPYVLLEAAAAELPIIATEAADTAYSMQIPTKNASVIAEAILKIQGRKVSASTLFRLETMMERTIELY